MKHITSVGLAILACSAMAWSAVHAGGFQIAAQTVSPGGGSAASAGGCRQLEATFGEAAGGRSSGGDFVVVAGFQAQMAAYGRDSIFNHGFQECL